MSMENRQHEERFQAFFKVYLPTSAMRLIIPEAYVTCLEERIPQTTTLRHENGKFWTVKLEQLDNRLVFTDGWDKYVQDNSLECGDFLFFQCIEHGVYRVKLLNKHGCEKNEPQEVETAEQTTPEKRKSEDDSTEGKAVKLVKDAKNKPDPYGKKMFKSGFLRKPKNPFFVTSIRTRRRNELFVPIAFIEDHKLSLPARMTLKDKKGRTWISKWKEWKDGRICYYGGWSRLCQVNMVTENDICVCELKTRPGSMYFRVHVVREHRIIQALS